MAVRGERNQILNVPERGKAAYTRECLQRVLSWFLDGMGVGMEKGIFCQTIASFILHIYFSVLL